MSRSIQHYSRVHYRVPVHYPAVLVDRENSAVVVITDLSVQGCAVEHEQYVLQSSDVEVRLQCPAASSITLTAIVRWQDGRRYGLEFVGLSNRSYEELRRVVIDQLMQRVHSAEGSA
jgi:hypothetical protein